MASTKKLDLYKTFAADYATPRAPALVEPHPAQYLAIEGRGEPGGPVFTTRLGLLYNIAFTIKMAKKFGGTDYAVCKLEGLWWGRENTGTGFFDEPRSEWCSTPDPDAGLYPIVGSRCGVGAVAGTREGSSSGRRQAHPSRRRPMCPTSPHRAVRSRIRESGAKA
jgi:hypothetical protein